MRGFCFIRKQAVSVNFIGRGFIYNNYWLSRRNILKVIYSLLRGYMLI